MDIYYKYYNYYDHIHNNNLLILLTYQFLRSSGCNKSIEYKVFLYFNLQFFYILVFRYQ